MSLLHIRWGRQLLPTIVLGLFFCVWPIHAADELNQPVVVEGDEVDLAKLQAGGKIVMMSSGARVGGFRAIDDDHRTTFRFSADDPRPTLVVELIENRPIYRVSTVVGSKSEKIDVYLLNALPRQLSELDDVTPIGSIVDPGVAREARLDFAPQNARYVALRWTLSKTSTEPLNVAEVSAFAHGDSPVVSPELAATDPPVYLVAGPPVLSPVSP